ncbi:MAG: PleD family two-component system response regulator [Moorea sp. SIO3I7]|uniref:GGDEF domain-containing response regulator n=1 Tax=Moorena sp. SIO3I8 TaxID=2607833 RepID=UPI0013C07874|nr:PleD family two-component system response regulator [Moorena sp. SIO3I8]NEO02110.1 PleD family two-component system response regulator [Moorena sp. SIO3I7]NEO08959.1 PleD family two-component system response regulator [Moorena sp. SIO3I8]
MDNTDLNNFKNKTPQVLVVDDEKIMRLVLRRSLTKEGYKVIEASNGEQCLNICEQQLPDIVLLDARMPIIDGFTCCAKLKDNFGSECPPILMITALHDEESVERAFEAGATDYITKPINWAVLRRRVHRLIESSWTMKQLKIANKELERLATIDGLTQVANRRAFDEYLNNEWSRLAREEKPLSLVLCDIDFFKLYNDTYGHQSGDECLKQVAQILDQAAKRPADMVARYGGEEFVVMLPSTDIQGAIQVAETIETKLYKKAIPHSGSLVSDIVTVSLGCASTITTGQSSPYNLLSEADKALYHAKVSGRNRMVHVSY